MQTGQPSTRIVLDLEGDAATISGSLAADGRPKRRFWGWLELLAALEALRSADSSDAKARPKGGRQC